MLVLSRKKNESIVINGDIRIEVLQIKGKQIRLGITAPSSMKVLRGELPQRQAEAESAETVFEATLPFEPAEISEPVDDVPELSRVSNSASRGVPSTDLHKWVSAVLAAN